MHRTDEGGVDDGPGEVDRLLAPQPVQQQAVQCVPHAGPPPLVQAVPQGHAAAAHLAGEVLPGDAGLEYEQDAGEADAVVHPRVPALGAGLVPGQQGLDQLPQLVGDQRLGHGVLRDKGRRTGREGRANAGVVLEALRVRPPALN